MKISYVVMWSTQDERDCVFDPREWDEDGEAFFNDSREAFDYAEHLLEIGEAIPEAITVYETADYAEETERHLGFWTPDIIDDSWVPCRLDE